MISRRKLAASVVERLFDGEDRALISRQLAAYIIENNLEDEIDRLLADIDQQLAARGKVQARVTTARPLDKSTKQQVINYVHQYSRQDANITLDEQVDPAIIGGVIIETAGQRLDLSVAHQLKQLRNA